MNEFLFVSVQYLAYIYHFVKEWRKNPKWSFSCCLALLLPLNQLQGEIRGFTETNIMKQQLQTGKIEMPTIGSTLRESGAVDVTLEEHAEREQEEATTDEKTIAKGVSTITKVICASTLRESGAVNIALEDYTEREQEKATTDEKTIEQGVQTIVKVIHEPPRETYDSKL